MAIRIGIFGYGNLGRGTECAVRQNPDLGGSDSGSAPAPNPMQGVPGI